jgi:hypothetical protein
LQFITSLLFRPTHENEFCTHVSNQSKHFSLNRFSFFFFVSAFTVDPDLDKLGKGKEFAGGEDYESDLQVSASAFEALERDFQEVI